MLELLLVDDHELVREGLKRMLEKDERIRVVGEAACAEEAVEQAQLLSPDVILMDIKMPGMSGIEAIRLIKAAQPAAKIIVLTLYQNEYLGQAAEAGATGYLLKDVSGEELISAIWAAYSGQIPLAPSITRTLLTDYVITSKTRRECSLSERQMAILRLIAQGVTNKEISSSLFISEATVKREARAIFTKLGVTDRAQAVAEAYRGHLL